MTLVRATDIGKYFGGKDVFSRLTFRVGEGARIGLVGPNGEGKSTLLRIIAGLEEPSAGQVERRQGLRVGFLPQDPPPLTGKTLWDLALEGVEHLRRLEATMNALAQRIAAGDEDALSEYSALHETFEHLGGYTYEVRVRTVLNGLGFTPEQHRMPVEHLSGGQRTRALLARLLLESPDLLLLDEPTNHLDMQALEWLENWLSEYKGSFIVIAHDRYFLDHVANRIWELGFGRLETYRGNYTAYLRQREERFQARLKTWKAQQEYIQRTEEFIRRHIAGQRSKEARGRRTRLQRFLKEEAIERPREHRRIHVRLQPRYPSGELVYQTRDLVIGYDHPLVRVPDLTVRRGDRVAIVGPNGAGKTTLVRTLLGEIPPLRGTVRRGTGVRVGYISQLHRDLDPDATVLDILLQAAPRRSEEEARTLLGQFLFHGDEVFKPLRDLSGGQRTRVILALLSIRRPNTLILDEPTNHLDIPSQEILQEVLQHFEGTILFVSHDRYLIQALATHIWAIEGGTLYPLLGGWEAYVRWRQEGRERATTRKREKGEATREWERRREERRARKAREALRERLRDVEERIHRLEERLGELGEAIARAGEAQDVERVASLGREYEAVERRLQALWEEWEQLLELQETST